MLSCSRFYTVILLITTIVHNIKLRHNTKQTETWLWLVSLLELNGVNGAFSLPMQLRKHHVNISYSTIWLLPGACIMAPQTFHQDARLLSLTKLLVFMLILLQKINTNFKINSMWDHNHYYSNIYLITAKQQCCFLQASHSRQKISMLGNWLGSVVWVSFNVSIFQITLSINVNMSYNNIYQRL